MSMTIFSTWLYNIVEVRDCHFGLEYSVFKFCVGKYWCMKSYMTQKFFHSVLLLIIMGTAHYLLIDTPLSICSIVLNMFSWNTISQPLWHDHVICIQTNELKVKLLCRIFLEGNLCPFSFFLMWSKWLSLLENWEQVTKQIGNKKPMPVLLF